MVELDGDDIRISSRGKLAERDIVQVGLFFLTLLRTNLVIAPLFYNISESTSLLTTTIKGDLLIEAGFIPVAPERRATGFVTDRCL